MGLVTDRIFASFVSTREF